MSSRVYHRTTCRVCGGENPALAMKMPSSPIADAYMPEERKDEFQERYPLDLYLCEDCGLPQLLDIVDPEILYGNYLYRTTTSPGLVEHFRDYAQNVIDILKLPKGSFVIEIGSNDGTLLSFFQEKGMKVLGVDPARKIAQEVTASGIETLPAFFTSDLARKMKEERGQAHVIIANNVMANIDDLDNVMEGVRELLTPGGGGVFILESGYILDTVNNKVFDNIYHEHISYFSVKPLARLYQRHHMQLFHAQQVATKGGSLRVMGQLKDGQRQTDQAVNDFIRKEEETGLYQLSFYKKFSTDIDEQKENLKKLLYDLKQEGKTIAGYCASHSVTTFLHYFDIHEHIDCIFDDNQYKHHTLSPGFHIPVLPSEEIYKKKPDVIIILAWRFYEKIMQKHQRFIDEGGMFVVPLPELKAFSKTH